MAEQRAAAGAGVQVGAEIRGAVQVFGHGLGAGVGGIHLAAQRLELGQGDIAGAARGGGRLDEIAAGIELGRCERHRALRGQRCLEDIGRGVQVALRVPAHEFLVLGEGHVAFQNAGAHARAGFVGFLRVFRKLQGRAAVADREIALLERALRARFEFGLERAWAHVVNEKKRAWAKLHVEIIKKMIAPMVLEAGGRGERGQQSKDSGERECSRMQVHGKFLFRSVYGAVRITTSGHATRESLQAYARFFAG